jgi:hypothetical protein
MPLTLLYFLQLRLCTSVDMSPFRQLEGQFAKLRDMSYLMLSYVFGASSIVNGISMPLHRKGRDDDESNYNSWQGTVLHHVPVLPRKPRVAEFSRNLPGERSEKIPAEAEEGRD